MLDLLRRSIDLLLSLLSTAAKAQNEMKGRFLLDVVIRESAAIFELLAGKN